MFTSRGFESIDKCPLATCSDRRLLCIALAATPPRWRRKTRRNIRARPIHIIVGFAAGGGNDVIARIYGQKLSEDLGQPVIVENKPGGGAIVATEYVAKSPADGYTLLVGASGMAINQRSMPSCPTTPSAISSRSPNSRRFR